MNAADQAEQLRLLVRLREVRMRGAALALAAARTATAQAEAERRAADNAAAAADGRYAEARDDLGADPGEAGRLLAVVDLERFRQSVARSALNDAREAERLCAEAERERRRAMILAHARHEGLAGHAGRLNRARARRVEERQAVELDEARMFR